MASGRLRDKAPELRVRDWIDGTGHILAGPLRLRDLGSGYKIIFCFQDWCPGCHARGFPTLQRLHSALKDRNFGFAVIQTVFEGADVNTFDKLRLNQLRYGLDIPFGQDLPQEGEPYPGFMQDYGSGGTPWFTVIDGEDNVIFANFDLNAERLLQAIGAGDADLPSD